jgi:hypothetical protein
MNTLSDEENLVIDTIFAAICTAPHSLRSQLIRKAFSASVQYGHTCWALLCRAFDLLIEEQYECSTETLLENMDNHACDGNAQGRHHAFYSLRSLVFAQAHRRLADQELFYYNKKYVRGQEGTRMASLLIPYSCTPDCGGGLPRQRRKHRGSPPPPCTN